MIRIICFIPRELSKSKPLLPEDVDDKQLQFLKHNKHLTGLKSLIELCSTGCALVLSPRIKELEENSKKATQQYLERKRKEEVRRRENESETKKQKNNIFYQIVISIIVLIFEGFKLPDKYF